MMELEDDDEDINDLTEQNDLSKEQEPEEDSLMDGEPSPTGQ
jgi:hypothetical protein